MAMTTPAQPPQDQPDQPDVQRKNRRGMPPGCAMWMAFAVAAFLAFLCLLDFKQEYLDVQQAKERGTRGTFTVQQCGPSDAGRDTVCTGTFRMKSGTTLGVRLEESADAPERSGSGSFPAVYVEEPPDIVGVLRDDAVGRANLAWKGASSAGFGVMALAVAGLGVLARRPGDSGRRKLVRAALIVGVFGGAALLAVGRALGDKAP
jgi:hypothetical protein